MDTTRPLPNWVEDESRSMCCLCGAAFGVFKRRHHCRRCGEVVCAACSAARCVLQEMLPPPVLGAYRKCVDAGIPFDPRLVPDDASIPLDVQGAPYTTPLRTCDRCVAERDAPPPPLDSLHQAAASGSLKDTLAVLKQGVDVEATDHDGYSPLHRLLLATRENESDDALYSRMDSAELFSNSKSRVTVAARGGMQRTSSIASMPDLTRLARSPSPSGVSQRGSGELKRNSLHGGAAANGFGRELAERSKRAQERAEVARALVAAGADVDATDESRRTPLHYAVHLNQYQIAEVLLVAGAHVEAKDHMGRRPLHYIHEDEQVDLLRLLLQHDAQVESADVYGLTPLHFAVASELVETAHVLIQAGSDVNAVGGEHNQAALHLALCVDEDVWLHAGLPVVHGLLKGGADINVTDATGRTPLHYAVERQRVDAIHLFLENADCDVSAADMFGTQAIHLCAKSGGKHALKTMELLLAFGAKLHARDCFQNTPLHIAAHYDMLNMSMLVGPVVVEDSFDPARNYNYKISRVLDDRDFQPGSMVSLLLNHGANVDAVDDEGGTPLHVAAFHSNIAGVRLLLQFGADIGVRNNIGLPPVSPSPVIQGLLLAAEELSD